MKHLIDTTKPCKVCHQDFKPIKETGIHTVWRCRCGDFWQLTDKKKEKET